MPVEEAADLPEGLLGFRQEREQELRVALAFEDLEHGFAAGLAELPVGPDGVAQEEVARA